MQPSVLVAVERMENFKLPASRSAFSTSPHFNCCAIPEGKIATNTSLGSANRFYIAIEADTGRPRCQVIDRLSQGSTHAPDCKCGACFSGPYRSTRKQHNRKQHSNCPVFNNPEAAAWLKQLYPAVTPGFTCPSEHARSEGKAPSSPPFAAASPAQGTALLLSLQTQHCNDATNRGVRLPDRSLRQCRWLYQEPPGKRPEERN